MLYRFEVLCFIFSTAFPNSNSGKFVVSHHIGRKLMSSSLNIMSCSLKTSSSLKTYVLLLKFHCRGNKIINVITLLLLFPDTTSIFAFTSAHSTSCTGKQSLKAFFNRWWLYVTRTLPMEG